MRYVGLTGKYPLLRLQEHRSSKQATSAWIREEIAKGRTVTIVVEEQFDGTNQCVPSKASEAELRYIEGYRRLLGDKLLNKKPGRKSPLKMAYAVPQKDFQPVAGAIG